MVEHAGGERFDLVTARAVSPLPELAGDHRPASGLPPRLLVWAGTRAAIDAALRALPYRASVEPVQVPGLRAERHLVTVELVTERERGR